MKKKWNKKQDIITEALKWGEMRKKYRKKWKKNPKNIINGRNTREETAIKENNNDKNIQKGKRNDENEKE